MSIIFDMHSMSESTWVEYTHPTQLDQSFSPKDNFIVRFNKPIATSSLVVDHFKILKLSNGEELEGIFRDIALHNDYNDVGLKLRLRLTRTLDPDTEYIFYIDGLYDAAGNDQDRPHSVVFKTEDVTAVLEPELLVDSVIGVKDKTISRADIGFSDLGSEDVTPSHTAYMDPTDGAYNVSRETETLFVTFSPASVTDVDIKISKRQISNLETVWRDVEVTYAMDEETDYKVEIYLPQIAADTYIEPGYEYKVIVTATQTGLEDLAEEINERFEFQFMGELEYMFTTVSSVLMMSPGWTSYDVARMIYLNSIRTISINPRQLRDLTVAGQDFTLYSTLWMLTSAVGSDAKRIMLGDLQVDIDKGSSSKWEELMLAAEMRLTKVGPRYARKGANHTSPFAGRDWDEDGTYKRRIGY